MFNYFIAGINYIFSFLALAGLIAIAFFGWHPTKEMVEVAALLALCHATAGTARHAVEDEDNR